MTDKEVNDQQKLGRRLLEAYNAYRRRDYPKYKGAAEALKLDFWVGRSLALASMGVTENDWASLFDFLYGNHGSNLYPQQALSHKYVEKFVRSGPGDVARRQLKEINWSVEMFQSELNAGRDLEQVLTEQLEYMREAIGDPVYSEGKLLPRPDFYDPVVCFILAVRFRLNHLASQFRDTAMSFYANEPSAYRQSVIGTLLQEYGLVSVDAMEVSS